MSQPVKQQLEPGTIVHSDGRIDADAKMYLMDDHNGEPLYYGDRVGVTIAYRGEIRNVYMGTIIGYHPNMRFPVKILKTTSMGMEVIEGLSLVDGSKVRKSKKPATRKLTILEAYQWCKANGMTMLLGDIVFSIDGYPLSNLSQTIHDGFGYTRDFRTIEKFKEVSVD